jgi:hypothetical protein
MPLITREGDELARLMILGTLPQHVGPTRLRHFESVVKGGQLGAGKKLIGQFGVQGCRIFGRAD